METLTEVHAKLLYYRFSVIYGDKFAKPNHDDNFKTIWYEEWISGLAGIDIGLIKGALAHCKMNLEWPPSIAEFRGICERASGLPSMEDALRCAIAGQYTHPVIKLAYDKVGSWAMKHESDVIVRQKFTTAYQAAVNLYRADPKRETEALELFLDNQKRALPPPPKIPIDAEFKGWRERLDEWKAKASAERAKLTPIDHPVWDKGAVTLRHRKFNQQAYNDRRAYLMGLDEITAGTLSQDDWYDRIRFLREEEANRRVNRNGGYTDQYQPPKSSPWASNESKTVYKKWMYD